ncbi:MAG: hypothetical protein K2Z81_23520 [Cyanobacteria bacterium]|nr:hypothetical protein [Cyanobacteriota bacterium]
MNLESATGGDITGDDVRNALNSIEDELAAMNDKFGADPFRPTRILFKTRNDDGGDGRFLSEEAIMVLTQTGVRLVGIDMPGLSAKPLSGTIGFSYLVNLCLDYLVPGSHYRILSPPLSAKGASPAPVRPVLVS